MPETGEEIVGAWLRYLKGCDFVEYGVQVPGAGEIDVVGLSLKANRAYICEVASHIHGLQYKDNEATIVGKFKRAKQYADSTLFGIDISYEFWSPVVRSGSQMGSVTKALTILRDEHRIVVEPVVNESYLQRLSQLRAVASKETRNASHPILRFLQIEERSSKYAQPH